MYFKGTALVNVSDLTVLYCTVLLTFYLINNVEDSVAFYSDVFSVISEPVTLSLIRENENKKISETQTWISNSFLIRHSF